MIGDTIAAIATPSGTGAISLVRLSGPGALNIAEAAFRAGNGARELVERQATWGYLVDSVGEVIDEAIATRYVAPRSFTGEEVVEFSGHGGVLVTRAVLERLLELGARLADPGEFSQRSFLNGKMDLTQAEAIMDLIEAQTELALRAANEQLSGRLGAEMAVLREEILGILSHLEAYIDFPDEDIDPDTGAALGKRLESAGQRVEQLLATANQGRILRHGAKTVIVGAPNVGKSSLLNLLLGFDRAIVSEIAGTTRDTIEEVINVRGYPLRLIDTAGLRESEDVLEREGIARTEKMREEADLLLEVYDASEPRPSEFAESETQSHRLILLNKVDLGEHASWQGLAAVRLSCVEERGVETLCDQIEERMARGHLSSGDHLVAINARHRDCLQRARNGLATTLEKLCRGESPEFLSLELRVALDAIGEVVGKADAEELLDHVFGNFCIGK